MATTYIARGGPGEAGLGQNQKYAIHPGLATSGDMSKQQQLEWLKRSKLWPTMQASHYIGKRVLGAGSHGIVGVWQREQPSQGLPKLIVVKQVNAWSAGDQLRVESKLLRDLVGTGSEHVVTLYRSYYRDGGSGTEAERDPLPFDANHVWRNNLEVGRMYMEYCQYGSLESALENIFEDPDAVIPEEYIWRLLRCLACALAALQHGSESSDYAAPSWVKTMVHFDIKPANILMSSHGDNHPRLPIFKLADFGLGLPLPREILHLNTWHACTPAFKTHWRDDTIWRGTPGYTPPEQIWPGVDHGRIGLCSDVWSLGVILYELMTGKIFQTVRVVGVQQGMANVPANEFTQHMFLRVPQNNAQPPFPTFGRDIIHRPYSKRLIYLTHQCLAVDPQRRPSPRALLQVANGMMEDVYRQPVRSIKKTVLDNQAIRSARRFNHNLLARLSHTDINAFNGLHRLIRIQPPQPVGVPLWPVQPESGANNLPNFAPSQPLQANQNINQYPWRNTVPGGRPQPPTVETRRRKRGAERSRRRLTGS